VGEAGEPGDALRRLLLRWCLRRKSRRRPLSPTRLPCEGSATRLGAHGGPAVPFASGTEATFTFTPDDSSYSVNLTVLDTRGAAGTATPVASHVTNVRPSVNLDLTQPVTNAAVSPGNLTLTLADPLPGVARGPLPQRPRASASGTNTWRSAPPCGSFSRQHGPSQVALEGER
jgi:hypothetical protein